MQDFLQNICTCDHNVVPINLPKKINAVSNSSNLSWSSDLLKIQNTCNAAATRPYAFDINRGKAGQVALVGSAKPTLVGERNMASPHQGDVEGGSPGIENDGVGFR